MGVLVGGADLAGHSVVRRRARAQPLAELFRHVVDVERACEHVRRRGARRDALAIEESAEAAFRQKHALAFGKVNAGGQQRPALDQDHHGAERTAAGSEIARAVERIDHPNWPAAAQALDDARVRRHGFFADDRRAWHELGQA